MKKNIKKKNVKRHRNIIYTFDDGFTITPSPGVLRKAEEATKLLSRVKNLHEFLGRSAK